MSILLNGKNLSWKLFQKIVFEHHSVGIHPSARTLVQKNTALLASFQKRGDIVYGLNTGFGVLSNIEITEDQIETLQHNLIRSHSCGVGLPYTEIQTRAILLLRIHALCAGYSGVRLAIIESLIALLNKNILPYIPQKGSVGASGDLAPLAHLALVLIGEGSVLQNQKRTSSVPILKKAGISPLKLMGREGLALINGTQVMTAISALNVLEAQKLMLLFTIAGALSLEACLGSQKPFHELIHRLRPHAGQINVANLLWSLTQQSEFQKAHVACGKVQDPYSFRCMPQVHGSTLDTLAFVSQIVETELNAVTDNPLFFTKEKMWLSGGNFHGQYLSNAMDYLSIAFTSLAHMSECRIEKLLDPQFSGLPACLASQQGLESGLMLAHVTAAALASENKTLAHPASVDTIPTSGSKEDHVSMGVGAALKCHQILENAKIILAIELLSASQAIELRRPLKTNPLLEKVQAKIRTVVPPITGDRIFSQDIEKIVSITDDLFQLVSQNI
ncbi:MAG: histidine ammonia-lyase [Deltaproteobacteria bacterium]|nr:histidine ammonia-lyase [Deltaproteobacteria bacterium]